MKLGNGQLSGISGQEVENRLPEKTLDGSRTSPKPFRTSPETFRTRLPTRRTSPQSLRTSPPSERTSPEHFRTSPQPRRTSPQPHRTSPPTRRTSPLPSTGRPEHLRVRSETSDQPTMKGDLYAEKV